MPRPKLTDRNRLGIPGSTEPKPPGRFTNFDHEAAFEFWYKLDHPRSYRKVAAEFGVRYETIAKLAGPKKENWQARAADLDRQVTEQTMKIVVRDRAKRNAAAIRLADTAVLRATRGVRSGALEPKLGDIPGLVKMAELLEGEATERYDYAEMKAEFGPIIEDAVSLMSPKQRQQFRERLLARQGTGGNGDGAH